MKKPGYEEADALLVSTAVFACLFGVSPMSVTRWVEQGMPKAGKNLFRLGDCIKWRISQAEASAASGDGDLQEERRRLIVEQRRGHEIENAAKAAELLPADEVMSDILAFAATVAGQLDALPQRLAPRLAAVTDPKVILGVLRDECRAVRSAASQAFAAYGDGLGGGEDSGAPAGKGRRPVGRRPSNPAARQPGAGTVADGPDAVLA